MTDQRMPDGFNPPPHSIEAEQAILGSVLVNNLGFHSAGRLRPEHFYEPLHAYTWAAIGRVIAQGQIATHLTLEQELLAWASAQGSRDTEWIRGYLGKLILASDSVLTLSSYADHLIELAGRRRLAELANAIQNQARDLSCTEGLAEQLAAARSQLDDMTTLYETREPWRSLDNVLGRVLSNMADPPARYSTGLSGLDNALSGGIACGEVYGFEARMKHFKTGTLGTIALALIAQDVPFLFCALEMGSARITERMIAHKTGCNAIRFRKRQDTEDLRSRITTFRHSLGRAPGFFADEPAISFDRLRSLASEAVLKLGIRVLFLDYWQLVSGQGKRQSSAEHLTAVAQWLAEFAGRNNVAVVVASQTNRDGYGYGSDGLAKACDWLGRLHKVDVTDARRGPLEALWVEVLHNRDGTDHDIGTQDQPAFVIDKIGPVLVDAMGMDLVRLDVR